MKARFGTRNRLHTTGASHSRVFVYFGAANYRASVYLNAQKLGDHEGGFTPFDFEATEQIREGENFLVVEVNDQRKPENVPGPMTDFCGTMAA